ncbi:MULTISPECIES: amidohydrolase [unclassified Fibrobacter]|uniref:amidohydrolase n=1 Tax=unclassified Fibrobacter TaxID=2634177 RepID=UPI000D79600C|nr:MULTISPECIES: amidohydrolase [unclassified Fibrobacter]PWJ67073.1 5-methylthioadenosine/S-adenosylhomocysteine deaminase [Fibrobacter sp. UWR4]PZW70640.1 5-methylthioadenosine/S-adenosylhomocysteine deaminase [Fibrobacter sp. UWR1]
MAKTILKSVLHQGNLCDILISNKRFAKIGGLTPKDFEKAKVVDCSGLAILPPFYNGHCHAAMTLLRGYADDMPLQEWLQNHIWPFEGKMKPKDIEIGSRLAVLEMIKSGTVFFADMYWHREQTMKVVKEMGIRATIGVTFAEGLVSEEAIDANFKFVQDHRFESDRVKLAVMPHSPYMVGEKLFKRCVKVARQEEMILHTHLAETKKEVLDCKKANGCTPVELMDRYGVLGGDFVAAHCVHLSKSDMELMADSSSAIILNPCSNLKLNSGIPKIPQLLDAGILLGIGTDGASSNNNLDMHEDMKFAALLAKASGRADTLPADEVLKMASFNTAVAYGVEGGLVKEGFLADAILVDLKNERLNPCHNLVSNWVYGADSSAIHSVICNGEFVMENRHVDGEEDIVREAELCAKRLA